MEQAVWPRAAVIWARCRNDTGLVEQYHPGPSVQGVNLESEPIHRCCVSACTRRPKFILSSMKSNDEAGVGEATAQ